MDFSNNSVLVLDDDPQVCSLLGKVATLLGFDVRALTDSADFTAVVEDFSPSVIIMDLKMPGVDGVQLLQSIKECACQASIIVVSGMDRRTLQTAAKLGRSYGLDIIGTMQKPLKVAELRALLRSTMANPSRVRTQEIRDALERTEFVVYYQPKIRRLNGEWVIDGAEALVRWQHRSLGLLMPAEFLQTAEEGGVISQLTDYVLDAGIRQISTWAKLGIDLGVAINLSARILDDLEFPDRCRVLLADHGVHGSKLTLELTESAAMSDPTMAMDVFLRLRMCDVGLSIDDFGTGFSSLQQLYQLPFDELKIDKAFTLGLPGDDEARTIVRAIVEMAHALDMRVCAEGVETRAALDYLETLECDQAQGFLISPAVPAKEFEALVGPWGSRVLQQAGLAERS